MNANIDSPYVVLDHTPGESAVPESDDTPIETPDSIEPVVEGEEQASGDGGGLPDSISTQVELTTENREANATGFETQAAESKKDLAGRAMVSSVSPVGEVGDGGRRIPRQFVFGCPQVLTPKDKILSGTLLQPALSETSACILTSHTFLRKQCSSESCSSEAVFFNFTEVRILLLRSSILQLHRSEAALTADSLPGRDALPGQQKILKKF